MATRQEQQQVFRQGKLDDPRDKTASVFLRGRLIAKEDTCFVNYDPLKDDETGQVFLQRNEQHPSAKDFLGEEE